MASMTRPPRIDVPVDPARLTAWRQAAAGQPLAAFLREAGDREAERRADKAARPTVLRADDDLAFTRLRQAEGLGPS